MGVGGGGWGVQNKLVCFSNHFIIFRTEIRFVNDVIEEEVEVSMF